MSAIFAPAQEPGRLGSPERPLGSLAEFWGLPVSERDRPLSIRLECDVLYLDVPWGQLWVRDASGQSFAIPGSSDPPFAQGQRVRLEGVMMPPNLDLSFAGLSVEVLGQAEIKPVIVGPRLAEAGLFKNQFVQIDGLVDQQLRSDGMHLNLIVSTEGRPIVVWVLLPLGTPSPQLEGLTIRLRGVYNPSVTPRGELASLQIMVPGLEMIEVLSRLEDDPRFVVPVVAIGELSKRPAGTRVRVVGTVHSQAAGRSLRMRDKTGQVDVLSAQSLALAEGELVEAIGFPVVRGTELTLEDGVYRRHQPEVSPATPHSVATEPAPRGADAVPLISSVQALNALSADLHAAPLPMDFECTVLHYDPDPAWNQLWIRDETNGAYVAAGPRPLPIRSGQRIRVTGTLRDPGGGPSFADAGILVLGEAPPEPVPLGDWREFNQALANQLVWTEGLVDQQVQLPEDKAHMRLFLSVDGRSIVAWVMLKPGDNVPLFTGSIVRVTGIYNPKPWGPGPIRALELMLAGPDRVQVIGQLATDPRFRQPAVAIGKFRGLDPDALVRVVGEVRSQQPGRSLRLRDATGEVDIITAQTKVLAIGEEVEAIGRPRVDGLDARLEAGLFRRVEGGRASPVETARPGLDEGMLTLAADVLELRREEADRRRPVQVRGVVTWAHPDYPYFFLQDSSGGVQVRRGPDPGGAAKTGREVEATGVVAMGRFAPEVVAERIARIGTMAPPEAPMVSLEHALTGVEEAQWVAMRGYLRAIEPRTNALGLEEQVLHLAAATGDFEAVLPTNEDVSALKGAVLRLRGVCTARADNMGKLTGIRVLLSDASVLQIEEPAPVDVFGIPVRRLDSLGGFATTQSFNRRVKAEGVVVYADGGRFILRDGEVSLVALTRETELPRPGERVEAVGFLGRQGPRVVLRETVYRPLAADVPLEPDTLEDLSGVDPNRDGHLVRVVGNVLDAAKVGSSLVLTVQRGSAVFAASLEGAGMGGLKGSEVRLTGVYDVRFDEYGRARSFALLMREAGDLSVIRPPSPFTMRRVLAFSGVLALGTAGVFGWVVALRRRVRRQTEQIREQLEREGHLQRELERAQRLESLGLLAGGIAHDFNNLLTVVMGNISLARFDAGIEAESRESLGEAERAIVRARQLTQQLLTFAKGGAPVREIVDLAGVVRDVSEFVLHGMPVRAEFRFDLALWPADVDKGQIGQVVQNIVINGAQAMPDGGTIEIGLDNVEICSDAANGLAAGRYVRLTVRDHGRGISAEDLPRIFDPYFTTKRRGSGLGLATVYSIVKRHGGDIVADSEPGQGTRIQVWLPAADGVAAIEPPGVSPASAPAPTPVAAAPRGAGPARVLVMDDEEAIQKLTQTILRRAGYNVTVVGDGAEAVREYAAALAAGRGYAVVLFDLTVPGGMGGRQALDEVRRIDPAVKAIVSSGYSNDPSLADHRELGFAAMVAKPYEVATLLETVQAVLRSGVA